MDDSLRQPTFFLHDKGLIWAWNQEDVRDLFCHKFVEHFERKIKILCIGHGIGEHNKFVWNLEFGYRDLPFDLAQGGESFDSAQDREPVERLVEPSVIYYLVLGNLSI